MVLPGCVREAVTIYVLTSSINDGTATAQGCVTLPGHRVDPEESDDLALKFRSGQG